MTKDYFPNLNRASNLKRMKESLIFIHQEFKSSAIKMLTQAKIDSVLGHSSDQYPQFLRKNLLICTNDFYSKDARIAKEYSVNTDGFNYLLTELMVFDPEFSLKNADVIYTKKIIKSALSDEKMAKELSTLVFEYTEKANRLWNPLQFIKRDIKKRILANAGLVYDYDVEGCAVAVFVQRAIQLGLKQKSIPTLWELYTNKSAVRNKVSKETDIDLKTVKEILASTLNGAPLKKTKNLAIFKSLGHDSDAFDRLSNNKTYKDIKEDCKKLWKFLKIDIVNLPSYDGGNIDCKLKASLYFQMEKMINDCFVEFCNSKGVKYFLQHDGFTTDKKIDVKELQKFVKEKTNFDISFSEDYLETGDVQETLIEEQYGVDFGYDMFEILDIEIKHQDVLSKRALKFE